MKIPEQECKGYVLVKLMPDGTMQSDLNATGKDLSSMAIIIMGAAINAMNQSTLLNDP
jgi:hypothetical protein